jgi:hypothetical protein
MKPIGKHDPAESNLLAEQIVLGSILLDGQVFFSVAHLLSASDFSKEAHSKIFESITAISNDRLEVTAVSVAEYLHRTGLLHLCGGPGYLVELQDNVGTSTQAVYYAKRLKEASLARGYADQCKRLEGEAIKAAAGKVNLSSIIVEHEAKLKELTNNIELVNANKIDYINANPDNVYKVIWPLGLHHYVNLFPRNIAIVAGASNAGKTAFLLNLAYDNRQAHRVRYLSSEMGPEELRLRLELFNYPMTDWKAVEFWDRSSDFAPMIDPDSLNIVDFLEIYDNFYAIGAEIKAIYDRLKTGIAVVAIQKKSDSQYARGGEFTLEKARLYVSIDPGVCKILKGKNWAQPGVNPKDKEFHYRLVQGCRFLD